MALLCSIVSFVFVRLEITQTSIDKITFDRKEAARRLGISVPTIDREFELRRIARFRIGRRVLFTDEHLEEYIRRNTCPAK